MPWKRSLADVLADWLRLIARAGLLLNCILLSFFTVYFVARGLWALVEYCETSVFGG